MQERKQDQVQLPQHIHTLWMCVCIYKALRGPGAGGSVTRMTQTLLRRYRGKLAILDGCVCVCVSALKSVTLSWIVKTPLAPN